MITLRDRLAEIIHNADCGCGGSTIDPAYVTLADRILETPEMRAVTVGGAVDSRGRWVFADDRFGAPATEIRTALLLPPIESDDDD